MDDPSITQERAHTKRKAKKDPLKKKKPGSVARKAAAKKGKAVKAKRTPAAPKSKRSVKKAAPKSNVNVARGFDPGNPAWDKAMTKRQGRQIARDTWSWALEDKKPGSVARKAAAKKGKAVKTARTKPAPKSKRSVKRKRAKSLPESAHSRYERAYRITQDRKTWATDPLAKKRPGSVAKRIGEYPRKTGLESLELAHGYGKFMTRNPQFKATKIKPSAFKQAGRALGRVGSKVARATSSGLFSAGELAWGMGSSMAASHRRSGKKTALQKSRASTHRAAKAGKPRYGSFDAALKADRRSQSFKAPKATRVKVPQSLETARRIGKMVTGARQGRRKKSDNWWNF